MSPESHPLTLNSIGVVLPFPAGDPQFLSPSLARVAGSAPAYELKFLIPQAQAERVEDWARRHLSYDPHANPDLGYAYRTNTLYLDTPRFDVYHRSPSFKRRKLRVRRYDGATTAFLERKAKSGDRVSKRRSQVSLTELDQLGDAFGDPAWVGDWFHQRVLIRQLRPACRITYDRVAHVGVGADGPLRLTMDRNIYCHPADGWHLNDLHSELPILNGQVILELKYSAALPALFKRLVEEMALRPSVVSKYRLGVETWGLAAGAKGVG
jgi:hypothetical protein